MTFRRFVDEQGRDWEVWEVVPSNVERRRKDRRVLPDRRRQPRSGHVERRVASRRADSGSRYVKVSRGFETGWLCFAAGIDVRRLAPVPSGWNQAPPEQLELWSAMASPSWKRSPPG